MVQTTPYQNQWKTSRQIWTSSFSVDKNSNPWKYKFSGHSNHSHKSSSRFFSGIPIVPIARYGSTFVIAGIAATMGYLANYFILLNGGNEQHEAKKPEESTNDKSTKLEDVKKSEDSMTKNEFVAQKTDGQDNTIQLDVMKVPDNSPRDSLEKRLELILHDYRE
jgi:hypothetical protein